MNAIKNFFIKYRKFFEVLLIIVIIAGALSAITVLFRSCSNNNGTTGNVELEKVVMELKQTADSLKKDAIRLDLIVAIRDSIEANRNSTIINIFKNEKGKEKIIIQNPVTNQRVIDINHYCDSLLRSATDRSTEW